MRIVIAQVIQAGDAIPLIRINANLDFIDFIVRFTVVLFLLDLLLVASTPTPSLDLGLGLMQGTSNLLVHGDLALDLHLSSKSFETLFSLPESLLSFPQSLFSFPELLCPCLKSLEQCSLGVVSGVHGCDRVN